MRKFLLFSVLLISILIGAQQNERINYILMAQEEGANFFDIVALKNAEIETYDLSKLDDLKEYKHFKRWEFSWRGKINQDGSFPDSRQSFFNAGILNEDGSINKVPEFRTGNTTFSNQTWTNIGPQGIPDQNGYPNYPQMGRVNAFLRIAHPTDMAQDVLFIGAPNGGVWKSTDGGANWTPKTDMVAAIGVTDIKTTPDATFSNYTTKPIYVSTGDYDGPDVKSIGVLKSTDGGETFSSTGLTFSTNHDKLTGDLVVIDENTVFVGTSTGISKTTDGGSSWAMALTANYSNLGRVAHNGNKIMYTSAEQGVFFTSDYNNDANWTNVSQVTGKSAVTVGQDGQFYIQQQDGQIKKFIESNATFTVVGSTPPGYNSQGGYNQALIVENDLIVSGEFNGQSSTDNGNNWYRSLNGYKGAVIDNQGTISTEGSYIHSDHHRMGKLPGNYQYWSCNDGGMSYISYASPTAQEPTITYKTAKAIITQSYGIALNPNANDGNYMMANQDNDTFSKKNGNWYAVSAGDGIQCTINYNNPDIRYSTNQNGDVSRSTTAFIGNYQGNGNTSTTGVDAHHNMLIDTQNPNTLYINNSKNGNTGWSKIVDSGSQLTVSIVDNHERIWGFQTHGNILIGITTAKKMRKINTDGTNGTTITGTTSLTGDAVPEVVDFNGTDPNIIYVGTQGYNAGNKVFKSTDGGANFTNITGDLPDVIIRKILLKQNQNVEILFLATDVGVYYTTTGGTNWSRLGQGLPNVDVKDIKIHYTVDKLAAGTYGRGMWEINIANSTLGIEDIESESVDFTIYPNPAKNDFVMVKLEDNEDYNYQIINVVGGVMKSGKLASDGKISLTGISKGMYLVRIFNDNKSNTHKLIIE